MKDRFKFRAWHKTAKEMLYEDNSGDVFRWLNEGQPIEIMQCTGLKDKNGKLIFEGDIVNYEYASWDSEKDNIKLNGQVIWTTAGFRVSNNQGLCANVGDRPSSIEIIGNIHA